MFNKVSLAYLGVCFLLASFENARLPPSHSIAYAYMWAIVAFSYPFVVALARAGAGLWRGLLILLLILAISHLCELVVILLREGGIQGILHPDSMTVALFGFQCLEPGGGAILWYPIGYLASWYLTHRKLG